MQHAAALRGIHGGGLKPKKVATVSPVITNDDKEYNGDCLSDQEQDAPHTNKKSPPSSPFRINQEYDQDHDIPESILQTKSSVRPPSSSSSSRFFFGRSGSNQDLEANTGRPTSASASEKYAVLGQKAQWRRTRSKRTGGGQSTIKHVAGDDDPDLEAEERDELGERASSYLSSAEPSENDQIPALALSARHSSREEEEPSGSSRSISSSGRRSENGSSTSTSDHEMFVITRQKKSKYAAKLYLPGQKPLYLGRYRSEDAAREACENAFTTITTPRK